MTKDFLNQKIDLINRKLMHLDVPEADSFHAENEKELNRGFNPSDFGIEEWDWPQGVGLYGLLELQKARNNTEFDDFLIGWVKHALSLGLPSRNINTTAPYLTVLDLTKRYDFPEWETLCKEQADFLINDLPKTKYGGFQHVTTGIPDRSKVVLHEGQMWDDTLFMAVLFLGQMGIACHNQTWIDESVHQFLIHIEYLYEKKTGLLYHGWDFTKNSNLGGVFWNRGNAWFTYGTVAYLLSMGNAIPSPVRTYILDVWHSQVDALRHLQQPDGLWNTILDDPDSYEEVSGSAAITAGILSGVRSGLLDSSYRTVGETALAGILANIADDGTVQNVSAGTSVGMDKKHYQDIIIMPMAYGQSLTSLALTEALYLPENS